MHRIIVPNHLLRTEKRRPLRLWPLAEVDAWVNDNARARVGYDASDGTFIFEDARDALMFKMRWC